MLVLIVGGNTETARIDGISAAGADPAAMVHTPAADLEVLAYGQPVQAGVVPVSPTGCPTPAVITRAVRELVEFDLLCVDAGIARPTRAPTVEIGGAIGGDIRQPRPVESAESVFEAARQLGQSLPDERVLIGETIPGGTTTALGVLTALGEHATVSSSLPENPLALKQSVVEDGLDASGLSRGSAAGNPIEALEAMGDPVLAAVAGLTVGATRSGTTVTLAGGTQMAAGAALARHTGLTKPLTLQTTSFILQDESAGIHLLANELNISLEGTDPGFDSRNHPSMNPYVEGEAKEGVGMGGALAHCIDEGVKKASIRDQIVRVYNRLLADQEAPKI